MGIMEPTLVITNNIADCIRKGRPLKVCANCQGVSEKVVNSWMSKGQDVDPEPQYERFASEILMAVGEAQASLVDQMAIHAVQDWRVADRMLKLIDPDLGESSTNIKISTDVSGTVEHKHGFELVGRDYVGNIIELLRGGVDRGTVTVGLERVGELSERSGCSGDGADSEVVDAEVV